KVSLACRDEVHPVRRPHGGRFGKPSAQIPVEPEGRHLRCPLAKRHPSPTCLHPIISWVARSARLTRGRRSCHTQLSDILHKWGSRLTDHKEDHMKKLFMRLAVGAAFVAAAVSAHAGQTLDRVM